MHFKFIEIRDSMTCIPALAIRTEPSDDVERRFLNERCGHPIDGVILMRLGDQRANSDPYFWADRTHTAAHEWLLGHFDEVEDGAVVDVRVILGEARQPAAPEIYDPRSIAR